jgi:hypothetical protein
MKDGVQKPDLLFQVAWGDSYLTRLEKRSLDASLALYLTIYLLRESKCTN